MELGVVIIILIMAGLIFLSFYMITLYNRIILLQNNTIRKFEPIDISIKKYINISNELMEIVREDNEKEELFILSGKLSRVRKNNKKILVLKDANYTINKVLDNYKDSKKIKKLKEEYEKYYNKILYAKDIYNKKAFEYNKLLKTFPYIFITKVMHIKELSIIDGEL